MNMYCSKCGKASDDNMNFCPFCGEKFRKEEMAESIGISKAEDEENKKKVCKAFKCALIYFAFCIVSIICFWLLLLLNINILKVAFAFVLPVAGIIVGLGLSYIGARFSSSKKRSTVVSIVLGCILIFAMTLTDYKTCYVDETRDEKSINHHFSGSHIGEYYYDGEPITFGEYIGIMYVDSSVDFQFKGYKSTRVNTGISTVIIYILQYIGAMLVPCWLLLPLASSGTEK